MYYPYFIVFLIPFVLWYRWRKNRFSYFINLGIPGPKPHFFNGNIGAITKKGVVKCHQEWIKKYGKLVGYFQGSKPILLVSDLEFIKDFMIVNHTNSSGREWFLEDAGVPFSGFKKSALGTARGMHWKELRTKMTPCFTNKKIKEMIHTLNKCISDMLSGIEERSEKEEILPMCHIFNEIGFNITMSCIYGIENDGSETYKKFHEDIEKLTFVPFKDTIIYLALCFPEFSPIFTLIREMKDKLSYYLGRPSCLGAYRNSLKVVQLRKSNSKMREDFVNFLINVGKDNKNDENNGPKRKTLTTEEIVINMLNIVIGSYEATVSTLIFTMYMIAKHPEIQQKVRQELRLLNENEDGEQNPLFYGIPYLDQVIHETLRYHSTVRLLVNRIASNDRRYKTILIPKNLVLQVATYQLHHDTEFWENPDDFDPDRFAPENKHKINPITYQGFGYGPRNCIGMRFAILVIRQILTRLLSRYKFEICDETETLIEGSEHVVVKPVNELWLKVSPAN